MTQQLTNAHEVRDPDPNNPFESKETEMDLHNNAEGIMLASYNPVSEMKTAVMASLTNGLLVYLNNLNPISPYYPTLYSSLIPTNQ